VQQRDARGADGLGGQGAGNGLPHRALAAAVDDDMPAGQAGVVVQVIVQLAAFKGLQPG
jgi:hypothetical protein